MRKAPFIFISMLPLAFGACGRSKGPIVAQVGDISISATEFANRLQETPEGYQQYVASAEGRRQFLNLMIREKILLYKAKKMGLQREPAYRQALEDFKVRSEQKTKDYQESLLVQSYLRRLRSSDLSVTDAEVRQYYDDHKDMYLHPVEVQASHILVSSPEEAQKVLDRLNQGESFEALARELSRDPGTASRGGKLAPFRRGSLVPEFEEAAFRLKNGETSGIVKTLFGYHIIRKAGEKTLPAQSFEMVKNDIRAHMERDKFDRWVSDQQAVLGVHIDDQAMAAVTVPAPPAEPAAPPSEESPQP